MQASAVDNFVVVIPVAFIGGVAFVGDITVTAVGAVADSVAFVDGVAFATGVAFAGGVRTIVGGAVAGGTVFGDDVGKHDGFSHNARNGMSQSKSAAEPVVGSYTRQS